MGKGISKHYVALTNSLLDLWGERLTVAERWSMTFIINRTIRFDKWDEVIPRRHVEKGVPNYPTGPLGISYRHWLRCIRVLRTEGLIQYIGTDVGIAVEVIPQRVLQGPLG